MVDSSSGARSARTAHTEAPSFDVAGKKKADAAGKASQNSALSARRPKKNQGGAARGAADDGFDAFWAVCPKHVGELAARKEWARAVKRGVDPDLMIDRMKRYAVERATAIQAGDDPKWTLHPKTWLRDGHWNDAPVASGRVLDQDGNEIAMEQPPTRRDSREKTNVEVGRELVAMWRERDRRAQEEWEARHG